MPMAANGQLMMQQQHQQQNMQRQQMSQQVLQAIMNSHGAGGAPWHAQVPMQERLGKTLNFISNLLLAMPQAEWHKVTNFGIESEKKAFLTSPDKQSYETAMNQKLADLVKRRQENAPELQNQITANAARQAQLVQQQHAQQQQQLMMNQMRGMGQPTQQGFQHLQHPMQVSQIPQQPQAGLGMGMVNPAMGQNRPDQRPFGMPTGAQPRPQGVPQTINGLAIPQNFSQLSPQDKERVMNQARMKYSQASDADKAKARQMLGPKAMPVGPMNASNDPAMAYFQHDAFNSFRTGLQMRLMQQQQQRNPGMPPNALQQQQLQQQMRQQQQQQAGQQGLANALGSQPGVGDGQLFANMDAIRTEQQIGFIAQQNGLPVVPGNPAGRNATPGPMNGLPTQPQANIPQGLTPMSRPQMPQGFNPAAARGPQGMNRQPAIPGRPGGLGGPPPNSHSPGMPNLNTPMTQPPIPMQQAVGQPPNTQQGAGMFNPQFNHQANQRALNPALLQMAAMNPDSRAQVALQMGLPEAKLQELLTKWQQTRNAMANGVQGPKQHPGPGVGGSLGQPQPGPMANAANQLSMGNNTPQPSGAVTTPGMPNMQMGQAHDLSARFAAAIAAPSTRLSMDSMDAPASVITQLRNQHNMPPEYRKWGQVKVFVNQNVPQIQHQIQHVQMTQFKALWTSKVMQGAKQQAAMQDGQVQATPNAGQNTPGSIQQNQGPGSLLPPGFAVTVTQRDIDHARVTHGDRFLNVSDQQLGLLLRNLKEQEARKQWAAAQQTGQGLANQKPLTQTGAVPTPQPAAALPPTPVTANARPTAAQKPGTAHETDVSAPGSATLKNARPPQSRPTPPNPSPATVSKKRPNSDETADASGQPNSNTQRPQSQPERRPPNLTPEQIAKLPPDQRIKYEAWVRSRQQMQYQQLPQTADDAASVKRIGQEEQRNALQAPLEQEVPMSPADVAKARNKIQGTMKLINSIGNSLPRHYHLTKDETKIRRFFSGRFKLIRQFQDGEKMQTFRDPLTISMSELDQIYNTVAGIHRDLQQAILKPGVESASQQPAGSLATAGPGGNQPHTQAQAQNRAPARSGQPPAAPTSTQPPYPIGNQKAQPTGEPTYFSAPKVTHANLAQPPPARKKQKPNPSSQPGQTSSPSVPPGASPQPKVSSPDLRRQPVPAPVPEAAKPQPKLFPCPDVDCEWHASGFPTEEARNAHHQEEHVKPFEDPFKFFEDSVGEWANSHPTGSPQAHVKTSDQEIGQSSAPPMKATLSRQGQAPVGKVESAATPMSRDGSMRRQGSAAGNNATPGKMAGIKSEGTPRLEDSKLVGRQDADMSLGHMEDPWANSTIDPQSLFASFAPMETITGSLLGDFTGYRSSTPNDTPESSKDSGASEPNSDISETANLDIDLNWQPMDENMLLDMSSINMEAYDSLDNDLMGNESFQFTGLDDMMNDFSKPYQFDPSPYSMDMA
ncbi:hypothetical protein OQA88_7595 [Cercophora sp. LCS_1]